MKVIVAGTGNLSKNQVYELTGIHEDMLIIANTDEEKELFTILENNRIEHVFKIEGSIAPKLDSTISDLKTFEKENSQKGWKNIPRYKR